MNEKSFYFISIVSLITVVTLAVLGEYYGSVSLLFNVMLTAIGVIAGILTSLYFAKQQERENLGKYASSAYRLSTNVYDSLTDVITSIEKSRNTETLNKPETYSIRLEEVANKLRIIQRFALSANDNWRDVLPPKELNELRAKEATVALVPLSSDRKLRITEEKVPVKISME